MLPANRHRLRGEAGVSLVELLVVLTLLGLVLPLAFGVLVSVQSSLARETDRSRSNDQARLAVEELDREIRSGNVLYDPLLGDACQASPQPANCATTDTSHQIYPGMSLLIFTQTNATTRSGSNGERCVQWRITGGQLQRRLWANGSTPPTGWRQVADHIVNQQGTSNAFSVDPNKRTVSLLVLVNQNPKHGSTVRIDDTVEGRNTIYGYPQTICDPTPPLAY